MPADDDLFDGLCGEDVAEVVIQANRIVCLDVGGFAAASIAQAVWEYDIVACWNEMLGCEIFP